MTNYPPCDFCGECKCCPAHTEIQEGVWAEVCKSCEETLELDAGK